MVTVNMNQSYIKKLNLSAKFKLSNSNCLLTKFAERVPRLEKVFTLFCNILLLLLISIQSILYRVCGLQ